jgi:sugar lactone lactonase YvrE
MTIADSNTFIEGSPTVGINSPIGVTMYDIDGESLIVTDYGNEQIIHIKNVNSNNSNISVLVPTTWSSGQTFGLVYEMFLDVDNSYNLYVCDSANNRVLMFPSMQYISPPATIVINGMPGVHTNALDKLEGPYGVKRDKQGNLYVTDIYNHRVMFWGPNATSGIMIAGNNTSGNSSMQLSYPNGLFLDTDNSLLYVADTSNNRIQLFSLTGSPPYNGVTVAGNDQVGTASDQLNGPCALWVSNKTGTMYIVDGNNNRIQRWNKGAKIGVTIAGDPNGNAGTTATMLNSPSGITINADETRMYITDSSNSRIQRFDLI